jgi:hypothetical protein
MKSIIKLSARIVRIIMQGTGHRQASLARLLPDHSWACAITQEMRSSGNHRCSLMFVHRLAAIPPRNYAVSFFCSSLVGGDSSLMICSAPMTAISGFAGLSPNLVAHKTMIDESKAEASMHLWL